MRQCQKNVVSVRRIQGLDCVYCGDPAEVRDHVIPYTYNYTAKRTHHAHQYKAKECVPSCRECNYVLNKHFIPTIAGRAAYLADKLVRRYRKRLNRPDAYLIWHRIGHCTARAQDKKLTPETYWRSVDDRRTPPDSLGRGPTV